MTDKEKSALKAKCIDCTLEGVSVQIGGFRNKTATLAPDFGGFWKTDWETVKRVVNGNKNFKAKDVSLSSWRWLGIGVEIPEALQHYNRQ